MAATADELLIARLRAGDESAFAELVREHGARMRLVARRILGSDEDARDALQDAFIAAFKSLAGFQAQAKLSTWLHRIAINAALMRLRARRGRREEELGDLAPDFTEPGGHHARMPREWDAPSDERMQRAETRALVRLAIDRLPDTYRAALVLRDIEGLETEQVAAELGITPNAAKIRVHRARQALRTLLEPHFAEQQP